MRKKVTGLTKKADEKSLAASIQLSWKSRGDRLALHQPVLALNRAIPTCSGWKSACEIVECARG